ncbi:aldo/keto reductase [Halorhabdus rudnickae]|uniref:aldo/keto reductase n=1 Tax=Halorhabdus rudnickae TaxID=1775544 RepID=UPI001083A495|nr:aldo/keto reductase [Halorhabdus rudnickae]
MDCLFVGAGAIAAEYASGLETASLSLAGVCDLDGERAATLATEYDCPAFTDLETALAAVDAPLVVNLTSHAAHAEVTRRALAAGRHVYTQKPLALDATIGEELLAMAQDRDLALGVAPENPRGPSQLRAAHVLASDRPGSVQLGYAHAHVGRVTDWHDRPDSFLEIGPLYDGGVYPLTLLVSWFGPVETVRVADALDIWPARESKRPSTASHIEATLAFESGPTVRLTASFYAPHRSREFYGLELHGDDGSLYLNGTGAMETDIDHVQFGRVGHEYTAVPPQSPTSSIEYANAVQRLAESVTDGAPVWASARRGAHVVAICNAIEDAAANGGPIDVPSYGAKADPLPETNVRPETVDTSSTGRDAIRLPAVGFGCSRYRDGEYVDRQESIATALDAGYRFLDSAELYGNEHRIGELLAAPGAPDREAVFILGKVWRTNHRRKHMIAAAEGSLTELGIDAFDSYALHWPDAWAHRGSLDRLAELPIEEQEGVTFPETADGEIETADISLETAWKNLEAVYDRGLSRTIGVSNVTRSQLETILDTGRVRPAIVQVERHPYQPRTDLVSFCHERGIRVIAHSPLSAPGLLDEPVLAEIGGKRDLSPAEVVIAWNVTHNVVPIPSSTTPAHIVSDLAASAQRLSPGEIDRIDSLCDPGFER